jgi:DNA modification methylase
MDCEGGMIKPYFETDRGTLYCGDCLEILPHIKADVMLTDPPYGINYRSGFKSNMKRSIKNDKDTSVRDTALKLWGNKPALVFGSWKITKPAGVKACIVWDCKGALGMGDLSIPWKNSWAEIYVLNSGFIGKRRGGVLSYASVQSMAKNGRRHPHQKPVPLLMDLLECCRGVVVDPFAGSCSTAIAAHRMHMEWICIEEDEEDCEIAVKRISAETAQLDLFEDMPA